MRRSTLVTLAWIAAVLVFALSIWAQMWVADHCHHTSSRPEDPICEFEGGAK